MNPRYGVLLSIVVALSLFSQTNGAEVVVLGDKNLTETIKNNKYVFLEFYAPWCGHCKTLEPEYEKVPDMVQDLGVVIGKIDATQEKESGEKYGVQGFPTLKFVVSGNAIDYSGERTAKGISEWIKSIINAKIDQLSEEQAAEKAKGDRVVIIRSKNEANVETLRLASASDSETQYLWVDSEEETINLYLEDKEPLAYSGKIETKQLSSWIIKATLPVIIPLTNQAHLQLVFSDNKIDILVVIKHQEIYETAYAHLEKFCKDNSDKFICAICTKDDSIYSGVKSFLSFEDEIVNKIGYIKSGYSDAYIAGFDFKEISGEKLNEWQTSMEEGKETSVVSKSKDSEAIAFENVVILTGDNFESYIKDNEKTFVEFYSPNCGHCKQFAPQYDNFAKQMLDEESDFKIAAVDCNQHQSLCEQEAVGGYPTLRFYFSGFDIEYNGERSGDSIKEFMEKTVDSKPISIENIEEIDSPCVVFYDIAEEPQLNMLAALFTKLPVYHLKQENSAKVVFHGEEEIVAYTGEDEIDDITEWLKSISAPVVVDLAAEQIDEKVSESLQKELPMLVFMINQEADNSGKVIDAMHIYCKGKGDDLLCGFAQKGKGLYENIVEWLSLNETDKNVIAWVNSTSLDYYLYDDEVLEISSEKIANFIEKIQAGQYEKIEGAFDDDSGEDDEGQGDDDDDDVDHDEEDGEKDQETDGDKPEGDDEL